MCCKHCRAAGGVGTGVQVGGRGHSRQETQRHFTSFLAESTTRCPLNAGAVDSVEAVQRSSAILSLFPPAGYFPARGDTRASNLWLWHRSGAEAGDERGEILGELKISETAAKKTRETTDGFTDGGVCITPKTRKELLRRLCLQLLLVTWSIIHLNPWNV